MPTANSTSVFQRIADAATVRENELFASWITERMDLEGARIFVASGSTTYFVAREMLKKLENLQMHTNSVPVTSAYMELAEKQQLAPFTTLQVVEGEVKPYTGMISGAYKSGKGSTLLYSPHGVMEKGLRGDRDTAEIEALLKLRPDVIMPVSWGKFGRGGSVSIKHFSHWRKRVRLKLVITEEPLPELEMSNERRAEAEGVLAAMQDALGDTCETIRIPIS